MDRAIVPKTFFYWGGGGVVRKHVSKNRWSFSLRTRKWEYCFMGPEYYKQLRSVHIIKEET
jgi:hypothetical protein